VQILAPYVGSKPVSSIVKYFSELPFLSFFPLLSGYMLYVIISSNKEEATSLLCLDPEN